MRNTPNNARLFRSLPDLPAERVDAIKSNLSADDKQLNAKIFDFFVGRSTDYCSAIGKRIVMEEIWVRENARSRHLEAEAVCGITVEKGALSHEHVPLSALTNKLLDSSPDMVNTFGVLHGGCTAFLVDLSVGTRRCCRAPSDNQPRVQMLFYSARRPRLGEGRRRLRDVAGPEPHLARTCLIVSI